MLKSKSFLMVGLLLIGGAVGGALGVTVGAYALSETPSQTSQRGAPCFASNVAKLLGNFGGDN